MQAVREVLEKGKEERVGITGKKDFLEEPASKGFDDCELLFHRNCNQVFDNLNQCMIPIYKVVEIVRALASRSIEKSIQSSALHFYSSSCEPTAKNILTTRRRKRAVGPAPGAFTPGNFTPGAFTPGASTFDSAEGENLN